MSPDSSRLRHPGGFVYPVSAGDLDVHRTLVSDFVPGVFGADLCLRKGKASVWCRDVILALSVALCLPPWGQDSSTPDDRNYVEEYSKRQTDWSIYIYTQRDGQMYV